MKNEFVITLLNACDRSGELFVLTDSEGGTGPQPRAWAKIPHPEWIPAQVMQYGQELNGCLSEWHSPADDAGRPACEGRFEMMPLEDIYSDWSRELTLHHEPADSRLHAFKVVDLAYTEVCVGHYHDAAQDPGLYVFRPAEGEKPYPLHLDLRGYVQLLAQSLGYADWQLALLQLLPDDGVNPAHRLGTDFLAEFRQAMSAWNPDFNYDTFVALYQAMRLENYRPSGLQLSGTV